MDYDEENKEESWRNIVSELVNNKDQVIFTNRPQMLMKVEQRLSLSRTEIAYIKKKANRLEIRNAISEITYKYLID